MLKGEQYSEEFFLEPSEGEKPFYSFIDGMLDKTKSNEILSVTFEPLDKDSAEFELSGLDVFNRKIPEMNVYLENGEHKIGVNLLWGGALDYLEDLNSNVQAVKVDGIIKVDSDASERYGKKSVNNNVNLINRHDTGRLVQQSYYGTLDYDHGVYYPTVQGRREINVESPDKTLLHWAINALNRHGYQCVSHACSTKLSATSPTELHWTENGTTSIHGSFEELLEKKQV